MAFPHARRAQQEHGGLLADIAAGRQRLDLAAIDPGLKAPVEILQGLPDRESRELEHGRHAPLVLRSSSPVSTSSRKVSGEKRVSRATIGVQKVCASLLGWAWMTPR